MTISIFDIHPIILHPVLDNSGSIADVHHNDDLFSANRDNLFNELASHAATQVELLDGPTYETHVWETLPDGTLSKLARDTNSTPARSISGLRDKMDAELTVLVVAPGTSVPQAGPPPPGTTTKKITVKVRKQGSLPV